MICYLSPHRKAGYLPWQCFFNSASLANRPVSRCRCSITISFSYLFSKWMDFTSLEDFETAALASHLTAYADISHSPGQNICQLSGALDETAANIKRSMRAEMDV